MLRLQIHQVDMNIYCIGSIVTWQQIEKRASVIHRRTVITKDMPLMNKTGMTQDERQIIGTWFEDLSNK